MSLLDRLLYRWACWWLDSPGIERMRRKAFDASAKTEEQQ